MPTASQFLKAAASQIGYREPFKNGTFNNDTPYGRWYGLNFAPYCAMGASWSADQVGAIAAGIFPKFASSWAGLQWFRKRGLTGNWPPRPGDVFIMSEYEPSRRGAFNDTTGTGWLTVHTGIVEKYLGNGRVQTIEFNTNDNGSSQGNGVYRLIRQDSENGNKFIYCRPQWDAEAPARPSRAEERPPIKTPASSPAPAPYVLPRSERTIKVANVRPGKRNEDVRRFNALLWARMSKAYRDQHHKAWMAEPADVFGPAAQQVLLDLYKWMADPRRGKDHKNWLPVPKAPVWPGPGIVRSVGGKPV